MDAAAPRRSSLRVVDEVALERVRRRLMTRSDAPWLHAEVARRLGARLPLIVQQPDVVLDWWHRAGASAAVLRAAYPRARQVAVEAEADPVADAAALPWWSPHRWRAGARAVTAASRVERGAGQLLWANMMLHWVADPQAEMRRWLDALAVDGFLMFSTLGPGTLASLRALYAAHGWPAPHAPFVDMHDLGDMLVHAGFADPVMDQEVLTLSWPDGAALLAELKSVGSNTDPARHAGLRTPRWRAALVRALENAGASSADRPALAFEIVYGHAFKPALRVPVSARTTVGLEDMRSILQGQSKRTR